MSCTLLMQLAPLVSIIALFSGDVEGCQSELPLGGVMCKGRADLIVVFCFVG